MKNNYTIVFNSKTYHLLYYEKNSFQPNVVNEINTRYDNGVVSYLNGDIVLLPYDKIGTDTVIYLNKSTNQVENII